MFSLNISRVRIVGNLAKIELDSLKQVLEHLEGHGFLILSLTTDRHKQVCCYMCKEKCKRNHQFDVCHVAKNVIKKVAKLCKQKCFEELKPWIKAIINYFWWSCATCFGNTKELKEKWLSILHNISGSHRWEDCDIFKRCQHKKLTKKRKSYKTIFKGSINSFYDFRKDSQRKKACSVIWNISQILTIQVLWGFTIHFNKYCPKGLHLSYKGMIVHSQFDVLDFSAGVGPKQAKTKPGGLRFKQQFSKVTQSWVAKKSYQRKTKFILTIWWMKLCIYNYWKKNIPFLLQKMFPRMSH